MRHILDETEIPANDKNLDIFTDMLTKLKKRNATERLFLKLWALWVKNAIIVTAEEPNNRVKIFDASKLFIQDVFGQETAEGMFMF